MATPMSARAGARSRPEAGCSGRRDLGAEVRGRASGRPLESPRAERRSFATVEIETPRRSAISRWVSPFSRSRRASAARSVRLRRFDCLLAIPGSLAGEGSSRAEPRGPPRGPRAPVSGRLARCATGDIANETVAPVPREKPPSSGSTGAAGPGRQLGALAETTRSPSSPRRPLSRRRCGPEERGRASITAQRTNP